MRSMKVPITVSVFVVIIVFHHSYVSGTYLRIRNNRYDDLVVAISPDIKEDTTIITKIQEIITEASAFLYGATRRRAYFGNVRILVPETWTFNTQWILASVQTFVEADIRIDKPSPVYGNDPYTFQPEGCGDPGTYIHLSKDFVLDRDETRDSTYGPAGRILVHEFSHLRYGVFDEYGIGTNEYPNFYLDDNVAYPTACTNSIRGKLIGNCTKDLATNLPGNDCFFVGDLNQNTVQVSVMYDAAIHTVTTFCESNANNTAFLHNHLAPNQQNKMCDKRGTWDVVKEHADFNGVNLPVTKTDAELKPYFKILYAGKAPVHSGDKEQEICGRPVVLVLDVSGSMSGGRDFKQTQTADKLIKDILPVGTKVGIVSFSSEATELAQITMLSTTADRLKIAGRLPSYYGGWTGIGKGLLMAKKMLERAGELKNGRILLITDGEENIAPMVSEVEPAIISSGIRVHAVAYSRAAARDIRDLANTTGGQYAFYSEDAASTTLDSVIETLMKDISTCNKQVRIEIMRKAEALLPNKDVEGIITIDPTLGNDTMFVFTLPQHVSATVTVKAPDGTEFTSASPEYTKDNSLNIIRFSFPKAQTGVWYYTLRSSSSGTVSLVVKALPGENPYEINSWLSSSAADLSVSGKPVVVYVHVHKGYSPVIDANVTVRVERPNASPVTLEPKDKGTLPDNLADDGVYSTYFTEYSDNDRYSLDVDVRNIPGKTTYVKHGIPTYGAAASRYHNTTQHVEKVLADNFTRTTSPGAMDVKGYSQGKDNFPPSRVTDLKIVAFDSEKRTVTLTWTAPGDDLNTGTAADYEIRMAKTAEKLQMDFANGLIVNPNMVISGSLNPKVANSEERITIETPSGWATIVFALQTRDDSLHSSGVSNIATATFKEVSIYGQPLVTTVKTPEGNPRPETNNGSDTAIIIAIVCGILGGFVVIAVVILVVSRLKRAKILNSLENPVEAQMTEPTVPVANTKYMHK